MIYIIIYIYAHNSANKLETLYCTSMVSWPSNSDTGGSTHMYLYRLCLTLLNSSEIASEYTS